MGDNNSLINFLQGSNVRHAIPFLPFTNETNVSNARFDTNQDWSLWQSPTRTPPSEQFFPLAFSKTGITGDIWYLPFEPMINISGKHNIIRRTVAKPIPDKSPIGTIKERWSTDDYEIQISGIIMGALERGSSEQCYPKDDFQKLKDYLTSGRIYIYCEPLSLLNIFAIVVEDFDFPFTKGENVQAYTIKAYSDNSMSFSYNRSTGITTNNNSVFLT